jgi:hypothetical protein
MTDAFGLSETIIADYHASSPVLSNTVEVGLPDAVSRGLKDRSVVDMEAWRKIDQAEIRRARKGKQREKFRTVAEMLAVLH